MPTSRQTIPKEDLSTAITRQFAEARDIFEAEIQSHQLMCRIYHRFAGPDEANHNCLGCNFDDLTEHISKYLTLAAENSVDLQLHHRFSMYALLLNSCWERMTDVFDIIGLPDGYRCQHFSPFIRARRWANFFKHPKTFGWLVHHPTYTIENSDHCRGFTAEPDRFRLVDDDFLKKYYSTDCQKNAGKLRGEFTGFERKTVVVLPNIPDLTRQICTCLDRFVQVITENPVYVEMLDNTSTIEDYYDDLECESDASTDGVAAS
jgi:hypothetical protein